MALAVIVLGPVGWCRDMEYIYIYLQLSQKMIEEKQSVCVCVWKNLRCDTQHRGEDKRALTTLHARGCQCLTGACDWLLLYIPRLTLPPVWLGRSAVVTRKQGRSRSPGLKISSGDMA